MWVNVPPAVVENLVNFHLSQRISMAPYSRWVLPSFRQTLLDRCDDYLKSSDRSNEKTRSQLITQVSQEITNIAQENNEALPDDLEKVIHPSIFDCLAHE
jgi:hypothetical protein